MRHTNLDHPWLSHVWATSTLIQHKAAPIESMLLSWALMSWSPKSKNAGKGKCKSNAKKKTEDRPEKNHKEQMRNTGNTQGLKGQAWDTQARKQMIQQRVSEQNRLKNSQQKGWTGGVKVERHWEGERWEHRWAGSDKWQQDREG